MEERLLKVCGQFLLPEGERTIRPYGNGHINDTYLLTVRREPTERRFILQRLNRRVFRSPEQVVRNIERVTGHLKEKIQAGGGDPERETLTLVGARNGGLWCRDEQGEVYRVYLFVERARSFDLPDSPLLFERSAFGFGSFQRMLADFPAETLYESIPDFHNTPARFAQLAEAVKKDEAGRRTGAQPEIAFAMRYAREAAALAEAGLPIRVTHNDTKLNNILMDEATGAGLCVIDLDTVMPGLAACDFGDAIRFGASSRAEDEPDLSQVALRFDMYEAYARGYLRAIGGALTPQEIQSLPLGAKLMTLECGMRFLADHLNGDVYFKVREPGHNLTRARNQFALARDMERRWDEMRRSVDRLAEEKPSR